MGQAEHHYLIFETPGGFCGIAWNNVGITRFQLPTRAPILTTKIHTPFLPPEASAGVDCSKGCEVAIQLYADGERQ